MLLESGIKNVCERGRVGANGGTWSRINKGTRGILQKSGEDQDPSLDIGTRLDRKENQELQRRCVLREEDWKLIWQHQQSDVRIDDLAF